VRYWCLVNSFAGDRTLRQAFTSLFSDCSPQLPPYFGAEKGGGRRPGSMFSPRPDHFLHKPKRPRRVPRNLDRWMLRYLGIKREDGAPQGNPVTAPATVNESVNQQATAPQAREGERHDNAACVTHESGDRPADRSTVQSRRAIREELVSLPP